MCDELRLYNHRAKFHRGQQSGFKCNLCNQKFLTPRKLRKHKKMSHVFTKTYQCHFCEELFITETAVINGKINKINNFKGNNAWTNSHGNNQIWVQNLRFQMQSILEYGGTSKGRTRLFVYNLPTKAEWMGRFEESYAYWPWRISLLWI